MGKKEKEIASKNAEYYKELNNSIHDQYLAHEQRQEEIAYETGLLEQKEDDLFESVANDIIKELKAYAHETSLPLCEHLDLINLENYISFVLVGCPEPKRKEQKHVIVDKKEPEPLMSTEEYESLRSEVIELTKDCDRIRNQNYKSLGEDELNRSYVEYFKGKNFTSTVLKDLVKKVGKEEYDKVVMTLGQIEYQKRFG